MACCLLTVYGELVGSGDSAPGNEIPLLGEDSKGTKDQRENLCLSERGAADFEVPDLDVGRFIE